jgi:hypothetical protein
MTQTSVKISNIPKTQPIVPIARIMGGYVIEFGSVLHQIMLNWQHVTIVLPAKKISTG